MGLGERILITIDTVTGKAAADLKSFKQRMEEADGATGKFKVGIGAAGDFIKQHLGQALIAGGLAAVAFGTKAVGQFQDLALEAGKMADATGLSVEEASRLIEVFGDVGVSSDQVQGAILKMNKAIGSNRSEFEKLGLVGATTNETFANVITYLNGIKDQGDRTREGTRLLGKSWAELAEVIEAGGTRLTDSLAEVSDQKIIDEKELAKARKLRDALDNAKEAGENLTLAVGGALVPALTTAADAAQALTEVDLPDWMDSVAGFLVDVAQGPYEFFATSGVRAKEIWEDALDGMTDAQKRQVQSLMDLAAQQERWWKVAGNDTPWKVLRGGSDAAVKSNEELAQATADVQAAEESLRDSRNESLDASLAAIEAERRLQGVLVKSKAIIDDNEASLGDKRDAVYDVGVETLKYSEAQAKANGVTLNATQRNALLAQSWITAAGENKELQAEVRNWIGRLNEIPANKRTEIQAALDRGDLAEAQRLLNGLTGSAKINVYVDQSDIAAARQQIRNIGGGLVRAAHGGVIRPRGRARPLKRATGGVVPVLTGEKGAEVGFWPDGSRIVSHDQARMWIQEAAKEAANSTGPRVTVNRVQSRIQREREIIEAVRRDVRRTGGLTLQRY